MGINGYFTIKETLTLFPGYYTPQWVRSLLRQGAIQGRRVGNTWLVYLPSFKRYLDLQKGLQ